MLRLMKYLRDYRAEVILGPLFKFLEVICELALPTVMALAINNGVLKQDSDYVIKMGWVMLGLSILGFGFATICQRVASYTSQGYGTILRSKLFSHILSLSHGQVEQFGAATLTNRLTNDVNQMQLWVAMMIRLISRAPFIVIGSLIMAFILDARLATILLASTPFLAFIIYLLTRYTAPLYRSFQKRLDRVGSRVRESLAGVRVIRAFAMEEQEAERFARENDELRATGLAIGRLSALFSPLTSLVVNITILAILWQGGIHIQGGTLDSGQLVAFISYVNYILVALMVVANLIILLTKSLAAAQRINQVLDTVPDIQSPSDEVPDGNVLHMPPYSLEFSHVSFSYHDTGEPALNDVTFRVEKGRSVGIIGATGSGKSTLASLIPRFYDATQGTVLINGRDVRSYPLEELRNKIGFVPQKTRLFSGTIASNLRWGAEDASDGQLEQAARSAQAHDFISSFPQGYQSPVTRDGRNLSGGQKQRLAIARALVRNPEILILDDSTSALDFQTEARLRAALHKGHPGRTLMVISQRVGAVKNADLILVCDNGRIVGTGTHDELYKNCSVYRDICLSQLTEEEVAP